MPFESLRQLDMHPAELARFVQALPSIQNLTSQRQALTEGNHQLAVRNLLREPELISARQQLAQVFSQLAARRHAYRLSQNDSSSPALALAQLQSAAHASERANEELIEMFLRSRHDEQEVNLFVNAFLHDRQETIELRCLAEKFLELYERKQRWK